MTTKTQRRIGYAAAAWAAIYATIALVWTVTGEGFPFGRANPDSAGTLRTLSSDLGAPLFAGVLIATTVVILVMVDGSRPPRPLRMVLLGFGWLVAGALLLVVPEPDLLVLVAYTPLLLAGAPFGWPDVDYGEIFTWPLANQAFSVLGGVLVAVTVWAWQRRTRPDQTAPAWTTPASAARWGRWAVSVAMAVPLVYATTRYAWVLRIPLTITDEFVDELHRTGLVWAGAWLASFATIGAVLTLGLARPWGERFPRWLPGLAGRRVPVPLAVVPAGLVSVLVTATGLSVVTDPGMFADLRAGEWVHLPSLLWPVWGVALGAATLAYYLRRHCAPSEPANAATRVGPD